MGLLSRIELISSPAASSGVPGMTILRPGHVREVALHALAVRGPGPQPGAERRPHGDRHRVAGAPVVARQHVDDRVEGARDEVGELELHHRPQPDQRRARGQAGEPGLGDRGVHHAARAELVQEALRHLERAAELADVLADEEHVGVAVHLRVQRQADDRVEVGAALSLVLSVGIDTVLDVAGIGHRVGERLAPRGDGELAGVLADLLGRVVVDARPPRAARSRTARPGPSSRTPRRAP